MVILGFFALVLFLVPSTGDDSDDPALWDDVPLPNTRALADYETWLYAFLENRDYTAAGWGRDKGEGFTRVRDTGPYIDGLSYGTHEAVRIYYSPSVVRWLERGRRGALPNGAMIVKEMFPAPAAQYASISTEEELVDRLHMWAVMVKDGRGARDGWFWAFYDSRQADGTKQPIDKPGDPAFAAALYPASGFGQYCTRCHSSAEAEMTFSSLRNIEGGPGSPLLFRVDNSWRDATAAAGPASGHGRGDEQSIEVRLLSADETQRAKTALGRFVALQQQNAVRRFEEAFPQQTSVDRNEVVELPKTAWDWVLPDPDGPTQFSTSVQCLSCHDGQGLPFGPNMFIPPQGGDSITSTEEFQIRARQLGLMPDEKTALEEVHAVAQAWMKTIEDEAQSGAVSQQQAGDLRAKALASIDQLAADAGLSVGEAGAILAHFPGFNVSPFGEWRWSMMGLAGRDPIFHAQLESEVALWQPLQASIENLCSSCHGVMGQRQMEINNGKSQHLDGAPSLLDTTEPLFQQDFVLATGEGEDAIYGALARDGISCMVCHQVVETPPPELPAGLVSLFSGNFSIAEPEREPDGTWPNHVFGPFEDVVERAMRDSIGMIPEHSEYVSSARLCGSCHTVVLPVLDKDSNIILDEHGKPKLIFEQTTYLEWANSQYRDEFGGVNTATAATCQDCHMPGTFHDPATNAQVDLQYRIANIQDETYPAADEEAPIDEITVRFREKGFARHTLAGINLFGLEMFRSFPDILGVSFGDYMTGSNDGLRNAIEEGNRLATEYSGSVTIERVDRLADAVEAQVKVENMAGHRFPSGVGFRRLFLEFTVVDATGTTLWGSGRTNELGIIVDGRGTPLPTEFFANQQYQPHHETISSASQVQIYEELARSPEGEFTTNFLNRDSEVKDNRLLPLGWSPTLWPGVTSEFTEEFLEKTRPKGYAEGDDNFGAGGDTITYRVTGLSAEALDGATVHVRLFYQAIPPAYLADRFNQAKLANGQRLYYIASHLDLTGTHIEDWKLRIHEDQCQIPSSDSDRPTTPCPTSR